MRRDGMGGKDADEDEGMGHEGSNQLFREEEELQMVFVDSTHDGTMSGRVEDGAKFGKMD